MIVKMVKGNINLNNILSASQKSFYQNNRSYCINKLYFPTKDESIIISFQKEIYDLNTLFYKFQEAFEINIKWGFFDYIREGLDPKKINVTILDNYDIIISNNLALEVDGSKNPLMDEFKLFLSKGKERFKSYIENSNLEHLYSKIFNDNFTNLISFAIASP